MLDLSFGLPIAIRDAALKLVSQGPQSDINKQYYAQNHEGELKDGGVPEEYEKTDGAARELLKRLAGSEPYQRRREGGEGSQTGQKLLTGGTGPVRNARGGEKTRGVKGKGKVGRFTNNQLPAGPADITPPQDQSIMSLFLTGCVSNLIGEGMGKC
jgi:pre-mRNA-splicing factor RBM22/SLT11